MTKPHELLLAVAKWGMREQPHYCSCLSPTFSYKHLTSGESVALMVLDRPLLTRDSLTQLP